MRYLVILLLLPIAAHCQSPEKKPKQPGREFGFNLGHAFDNAYLDQLQHGGILRSSIVFLKRSGNMQYGATVEGGTNSYDYWYMTPGFLANRTFSIRRGYYYAGAMAGYVISNDMAGASFPANKLTQGYVFGVQGGFVRSIGERLSFTSELAVRSAQVWESSIRDGEEYMSDVILYIPVTIGLRYHF